MDGACKKTWTKASCIDDTKDILYPRLIESDNQARMFKKALEKYPEAENKPSHKASESRKAAFKDLK